MIFAGRGGHLAGVYAIYLCHRYMRAIRSIWSGLACLMREQPKVPDSTFSYEFEVDGLLLSNISVKSGFALDGPEDPRYKIAEAHRVRFGEAVHRATKTVAMRNTVEGEDHVDAIISIAKAAEVFLLEYGISRGQYSTQRKVYIQSREYVAAFRAPLIERTDDRSEQHAPNVSQAEGEVQNVDTQTSTPVPLQQNVPQRDVSPTVSSGRQVDPRLG
jgi:hypothetical protein